MALSDSRLAKDLMLPVCSSLTIIQPLLASGVSSHFWTSPTIPLPAHSQAPTPPTASEAEAPPKSPPGLAQPTESNRLNCQVASRAAARAPSSSSSGALEADSPQGLLMGCRPILELAAEPGFTT